MKSMFNQAFETEVKRAESENMYKFGYFKKEIIEAMNYNKYTDSTTFYFIRTKNHYNIETKILKMKDEIHGLKENEKNKWIENRW